MHNVCICFLALLRVSRSDGTPVLMRTHSLVSKCHLSLNDPLDSLEKSLNQDTDTNSTRWASNIMLVPKWKEWSKNDRASRHTYSYTHTSTFLLSIFNLQKSLWFFSLTLSGKFRKRSNFSPSFLKKIIFFLREWGSLSGYSLPGTKLLNQDQNLESFRYTALKGQGKVCVFWVTLPLNTCVPDIVSKLNSISMPLEEESSPI